MSLYSNDTELFAAFQRGDTPAIKKVYELFFKPLCLSAENITGTREDAQDIVSDSFIKMLRSRGTFESLKHVKAFLYKVVQNGSLNFVDTRSRHRNAHAEIKFLSSTQEQKQAILVDDIIRFHVLQEIHAEIENLPDRSREVIKLIFIEGLSTQEIATRLEIKRHTVTTLKARGLQLLKSELLKKDLLTAFLYLSLLFPTEQV